MAPLRRKTDEDLQKPVGGSLLSPFDIRRMRQRIGLFQRELAEQLGVTDRCVRLWESGTRPIPKRHASRLHMLHKRAMEADYVPMRKRDPRKQLKWSSQLLG